MQARTPLLLAVAVFTLVTVAATLALGNELAANPCVGWTGYVPIGSCTRSFWSAAYAVGPAIGLFMSVPVAIVGSQMRRRTS